MSPVVTQVESVHPLAEGILGLRLAARGLPPFGAGAHVDLHLGNGLVRSYSLTNPLDAEGGASPAHYELAIGLAADSRGGSAWLHKALWPGMTLAVSPPRNHFALDDSMRPVLLVAGGIGVTPIRAMVQVCERRSRPWRLVYAARSRRHAAFVEEFLALDRDGRVQLHFDDEHGGRPLDIGALRGGIGPGSELYCCGPGALMTAVRERLSDSGATLHFEWFAAAPKDEATAAADPAAHAPEGFELVLARSGQRLHVPAGTSVLDALESVGIVVASVCKEGVCGTCECRVVSGAIDHRCQVLTPEERARQDSMMVCVSRAAGPELVLDL